MRDLEGTTVIGAIPHCNTLEKTVTYCNTLHHIATHCNPLKKDTT